MPNAIARKFNKPVRAVATAAEIAAGVRAFAAVNFTLDQGQKFMFYGIIAGMRLQDVANAAPINDLVVFGFENFAFRRDQSIVSSFDDGRLIYNVQQWMPETSKRIADFFTGPIEFQNPGDYGIAAGMEIGAPANGYIVDLAVLGEVVTLGEKTFPYQYR